MNDGHAVTDSSGAKEMCSALAVASPLCQTLSCRNIECFAGLTFYGKRHGTRFWSYFHVEGPFGKSWQTPERGFLFMYNEGWNCTQRHAVTESARAHSYSLSH